MRTCKGCGRTLPNDAFGVNRATKDGISIYCRDCAKIRYNLYSLRKSDEAKIFTKEAEEKRLGLKELYKQAKKEKDIYPEWFSYNDKIYREMKVYIDEAKSKQSTS